MSNEGQGSKYLSIYYASGSFSLKNNRFSSKPRELQDHKILKATSPEGMESSGTISFIMAPVIVSICLIPLLL
jgi:hypothetical protein